ncbi:MAG: tetratricopeptide repeat protein [Candidatus Marinimicrobia bacterium]|nr:tetratricopeptide repeat protein [Candidatus Neomarinimicrobiota bacterium]
MFTDIAGYTKAMSADEESALKTLRKKRSILRPLISDCNGTFVKEIGDGTLSYFPSAIDAATCAVKLQQATYDDDDMNLRIGVHVGDIVFDEEDVFGDGVNVAARLKSMAPVGGVCVSKSVFEELLNKKKIDGIPLGLQQLKGVGRLIDVFALKAENLNHPDPKEYEEHKVEPHPDDEVPSVVVLPLKNKGKEDDAFYADGITADLSRAGKIRVASMDDIETADAVSLSSTKEFGDAERFGRAHSTIGEAYYNHGNFDKSIKHLEKAIAIQKDSETENNELLLVANTYLFLSYKKTGEVFDSRELQILIGKTKNIEFNLNFRIFELLEDKSYLEAAYKQVQEKADALEDSKKFLKYPIPNKIVEAWESIEK